MKRFNGPDGNGAYIVSWLGTDRPHIDKFDTRHSAVCFARSLKMTKKGAFISIELHLGADDPNGAPAVGEWWLPRLTRKAMQ